MQIETGYKMGTWLFDEKEKKGLLLFVEGVVWCTGRHMFDYVEQAIPVVKDCWGLMRLCLLLRILRQRWICIDWVVMWLSSVAHGSEMMWTVCWGNFKFRFRRNLWGEEVASLWPAGLLGIVFWSAECREKRYFVSVFSRCVVSHAPRWMVKLW